jgi:anti-anti-sigma factor
MQKIEYTERRHMLDLKVESIAENVRVITLAGEFDLFEQDNAKEFLSGISAEKPLKIVIDLSKISFMDSTAVGLLLTYATELKKDDIRVIMVINENAHVERRLGRLLQLTEPTLRYFGSIEDALK